MAPLRDAPDGSVEYDIVALLPSDCPYWSTTEEEKVADPPEQLTLAGLTDAFTVVFFG